MKKINWSRYTPPGRENSQFLICAWLWLAGAVLWSLRFPVNYIGARSQLYARSGGMVSYQTKVLIPGRVIDPFFAIAEDSFNLFPVFWLFLLLEAVACYASFRQNTMSIYLMRRLPDRWELHRRCWGKPLILSLLGLGIMVGVLGFYFLIYVLFTPAGCLPF
jgi:hypothetical protein